MELNDISSGERLHIAFFGIRNAGKSSLVNAVTGQQLSVVSNQKGTTTDPVKKSMELLPLGPVVIIDTPGIDDIGELGNLRVKKAESIVSSTDIAVIVCDATVGLTKFDKMLIDNFNAKNTPFIIVYNKCDLLSTVPNNTDYTVYVSAKNNYGINNLKEIIGKIKVNFVEERHIVSDLLTPGDTVILVIPIDESAPKGRLILPQQQTIRDILDAGCIPVCCRDTELTKVTELLNKNPKLVITDSQVFGKVSNLVPNNIPLTSFSILFARFKGELKELVNGAAAISNIKDGDKILISEGCTHHRQCGDIGTVKLPLWLENFTKSKPIYTFSSGNEFPENICDFKLCIHCGGCMLNEREMHSRIEKCKQYDIPIVNYGIAIAHMHGILHRSLEIFPDILSDFDKKINRV